MIDRLKDVMRLNDGSTFSPQFIENKLKFSPYIREAVIVSGDTPVLIDLRGGRQAAVTAASAPVKCASAARNTTDSGKPLRCASATAVRNRSSVAGRNIALVSVSNVARQLACSRS